MKVWCRITSKGEIEFIDWNVAEQLAHDCLVKKQFSHEGASAVMAVAVRDYVLHTTMPDTSGWDRRKET